MKHPDPSPSAQQLADTIAAGNASDAQIQHAFRILQLLHEDEMRGRANETATANRKALEDALRSLGEALPW